MVTKEQKEILLKKKKLLELKEKQQKEAFKKEKGKKGKKKKQRKKSEIPIGELDYGWCPPLGDEPIIRASFENRKVVAEYSNKKRVR